MEKEALVLSSLSSVLCADASAEAALHDLLTLVTWITVECA